MLTLRLAGLLQKNELEMKTPRVSNRLQGNKINAFYDPYTPESSVSERHERDLTWFTPPNWTTEALQRESDIKCGEIVSKDETIRGNAAKIVQAETTNFKGFYPLTTFRFSILNPGSGSFEFIFYG